MIEDWQPVEEAPKDRWLLSYADLVTLLLAFFVVMYSVSAVNETKLSELASTLSESFNTSDASQASDALPRDEVLDTMLSNFPGEYAIQTEAGVSSVLLTLPGEVLFVSGQSELSLAGKRQLLALMPTLRFAEGNIVVEGHTDNVAIATATYPSNWELSAHRAAATVRFLEAQGVRSNQLRAVGLSDVEPVDTNSTNEGRSNNRRVVLRLQDMNWAGLSAATKIQPKEQAEEFSIEEVDPALLEEVLREIEDETG